MTKIKDFLNASGTGSSDGSESQEAVSEDELTVATVTEVDMTPSLSTSADLGAETATGTPITQTPDDTQSTDPVIVPEGSSESPSADSESSGNQSSDSTSADGPIIQTQDDAQQATSGETEV